MKLLNINIDHFGQITNIFKIKAVPSVFLVYQGKLIDNFTGEITDEMLDGFLNILNNLNKGSKF